MSSSTAALDRSSSISIRIPRNLSQPRPTWSPDCVPVLKAAARARSNTARSSSPAWRGFSTSAKARSRMPIHHDLGRPSIEIYASEIALVASEIALARKKLRSWTKPRRVPTSLVAQPGKSRIYHEPLGVVLIIGPWNYPLQLVLAPLVGAIAAGNCAIVKPSEVVPAISRRARRSGCPSISTPNASRSIAGRSRRDDRAPGRAVRPHFLHGQRHRRAHRHGGRGQAPDAGHARARRQEPVHRRSADRSRRRRQAHRLGQVLQRRARPASRPITCSSTRRIEEAPVSRRRKPSTTSSATTPQSSPDLRPDRQRPPPSAADEAAFPAAARSSPAARPTKTIATSRPPFCATCRPRTRPSWPTRSSGRSCRCSAVKDIEQAIAFVNARPKPLALYLFSSDPFDPGKRARAHELGRRDRQSRLAAPDGPIAALWRRRAQRDGGLSRPGHVRDLQPYEVGARETDVVRPVVLLSALHRRSRRSSIRNCLMTGERGRNARIRRSILSHG